MRLHRKDITTIGSIQNSLNATCIPNIIVYSFRTRPNQEFVEEKEKKRKKEKKESP